MWVLNRWHNLPDNQTSIKPLLLWIIWLVFIYEDSVTSKYSFLFSYFWNSWRLKQQQITIIKNKHCNKNSQQVTTKIFLKLTAAKTFKLSSNKLKIVRSSAMDKANERNHETGFHNDLTDCLYFWDHCESWFCSYID